MKIDYDMLIDVSKEAFMGLMAGIALCVALFLSCLMSCEGGCGGELAPVDTEIAVATTFVEVKGGTRVRMVGAQKVKTDGVSSKALIVNDGPEGRGILVNVDPNALCHLIIDAKIKPKVAGRYIGNVPSMPGFEHMFGIASWPTLIPDSCDGVTGICSWSALFKGKDCVTVAESAYYVGSTMKEFVGLPVGRKARILRIRGKCGGKNCTVPFGDAKAVKGAKAYVPHGWFGGSNTLDFTGAVDGVTADPRYVVPE